MKDERCMRTAIRIEELLMVNKDLLDLHALYVEKDVEKFDENTIVYLDNHLGVDEETDAEIYPVFAHKNDLQCFFFWTGCKRYYYKYTVPIEESYSSGLYHKFKLL